MTSAMRLADVVTAATGSRNPAKQPDQEFVYVDVAAIDNEAKSITGSKCMTGAEAPSRARKVLRNGDVLVSTVRPNLNAVALVPEALDDQIASTGFCVLRAKTEVVLPAYLFYFVRSRRFVAELAKLVSGALYPAVTDRQVLDQRIPVVPLEEQRRIVDLLSRAEGIVRLRREAQTKAQAIIPALFLDMFGDPATNPKGWKEANFGDIVDNRDGQRRPVKAANRANRRGEYPYYGASGIIDYVDDYIFDGINLLIAEDGANLLSRSTPIAFQATGRYWVNNHAHVVGATDRANLIYLETCLNLRDLHDFVTGSAQPKLTQKALNAIPIPLPSMQDQRRFETYAGQVLSICHQQQEATVKAEATFQALLARAFSGGSYE